MNVKEENENVMGGKITNLDLNQLINSDFDNFISGE